MRIPTGMTEKQVMEDIEFVVDVVAKKSFIFGCYDIEDIRQECRMFGVKLMNDGGYDPARPLRNYLYRHIRNRLLNLLRDEFFRNEPPCKSCAAGTACGPDGPCRRHIDWLKRNRAKASVSSPHSLGSMGAEKGGEAAAEGAWDLAHSREASPREEAAELEARRKIDLHLPPYMRGILLRLRDGVAQPPVACEKLKVEIKRILSLKS